MEPIDIGEKVKNLRKNRFGTRKAAAEHFSARWDIGVQGATDWLRQLEGGQLLYRQRKWQQDGDHEERLADVAEELHGGLRASFEAYLQNVRNDPAYQLPPVATGE